MSFLLKSNQPHITLHGNSNYSNNNSYTSILGRGGSLVNVSNLINSNIYYLQKQHQQRPQQCAVTYLSEGGECAEHVGGGMDGGLSGSTSRKWNEKIYLCNEIQLTQPTE